jgi:hypothetical protein
MNIQKMTIDVDSALNKLEQKVVRNYIDVNIIIVRKRFAKVAENTLYKAILKVLLEPLLIKAFQSLS